jgi:hypothetical protein
MRLATNFLSVRITAYEDSPSIEVEEVICLSQQIFVLTKDNRPKWRLGQWRLHLAAIVLDDAADPPILYNLLT